MAALLLPALLCPGCAGTVRLLTQPSGARLTLPDGRVVVSPTEVPIRRTPGQPQPITITLEGYRPVTIDLQRTHGRLLPWIEGLTLPRSGRELTVLMVAQTPDEPAPPAQP